MTLIDSLKDQDFRDMESWGRKFGRDNDYEALESAAEYLAFCTLDELPVMFASFEEGLRNNVGRDMRKYHEALGTLRSRVFELLRVSNE